VTTHEHWKDEPDEHDYPAAVSYLGLIVESDVAAKLVKRLKGSKLLHYKAKDILRASRLELLPKQNVHVAADLGKVSKGLKLSPVLLVRGRLESDLPLTIADGYHRVCASYHLDENANIPCRITNL
jgi:hypothetical protein